MYKEEHQMEDRLRRILTKDGYKVRKKLPKYADVLAEKNGKLIAIELKINTGGLIRAFGQVVLSRLSENTDEEWIVVKKCKHLNETAQLIIDSGIKIKIFDGDKLTDSARLPKIFSNVWYGYKNGREVVVEVEPINSWRGGIP